MRRWALILFGVLISSVAIASGWKSFLAPGMVGESHEDHAGDCDQCHLNFSGIPDEKCLDCHEDLKTRIGDKHGFHAKVADKPCITCHTDHHGLESSLTKLDAMEAFDHAETGFRISGAHAEVACETCHTAPVAKMETVCVECHADDDPHESALGPECGLCHTGDDWNEGLKTNAEHKVGMDGGHEGLTCGDCHIQGDAIADDVQCAGCHGDDHGGTESPCEDCHTVAAWKPAEFNHGPCTCTFAGVHQTASCLDCHPGYTFTDTATLCSGCHSKDETHDPLGECSICHEATSWKDNTFDHNKKSTFAIAGQHLEVDCVACHAEPGVWKGSPSNCEGCHQDHGDEAHGDFGGCADCHSTEHPGWKPSNFDHAVSSFALDGRHSEISCQECHETKTKDYPEAAP